MRGVAKCGRWLRSGGIVTGVVRLVTGGPTNCFHGLRGKNAGTEIATHNVEFHGDHSMSSKVILPDFTFPAQGPHPAVRALWVSGGLLLVATLILGGAVWHRHAVNVAADAAAARALATVAAPQSVAAEAASPAAPAQQALIAAAPAAAAAEAPAADAASAGETQPAPARHRTGTTRHHRTHRSAAHGKAVAVHTSGDARGSRNSSAKKDDAIDRLLKQFK